MGKTATAKKVASFSDPAVDAVFSTYPKPVRTKLLALRRLIFDTARTTKGVGISYPRLPDSMPGARDVDCRHESPRRLDSARSRLRH